jgi:hypothetical protein
MREFDLSNYLKLISLSDTEAVGSPLTNPIDRENSRVLVWRWIEGGPCVALMVLSEKYLTFVSELTLDRIRDPKLVFEPHRKRSRVRGEPLGSGCKVGLQEALKLEDRLIVESDVINVVDRQSLRLQTVLGRVLRKLWVMLLPGPPLLLRGGDDLPVSNETSRAIVIER